MALALVVLTHFVAETGRQIGDRPGVSKLSGAIDPLSSLGGTGVLLFFVLSGFLLFLPFARHMLAGAPRPSTRRFFKRRALRILPAYYVAIALTAIVFGEGATPKQVITHLLLIHNFSSETYFGLNGPTWSMAVESQFYALLPLLALGLARLTSRSGWWLAAGLTGLLLASPAASLLYSGLARVAADLDLSFLTAISSLGVFAAGMLAACLLVLRETGRLSESLANRLARAGVVAFGVIFAAEMAIRGFGLETGFVERLHFYAYLLVMAACYLGLLLHVLFRGGTIGRVLSMPAPRFLGDISFSGYLVHYPLLVYVVVPLARRAPDGLALLVAVAGVFVIVLPIAFASFWFVERPFLQRKHDDRASRSTLADADAQPPPAARDPRPVSLP